MEYITEGEHEVSFNGRFMADKHTHYEATAHVKGIVVCTITIPGHIETDFKGKYGKSIRGYILHVKIPFIENQHHVAPDAYKNAAHLRGTLQSLDEIVRVEAL